MYNVVIHHVTFSGPKICIMSSIQKRSRYKQYNTRPKKGAFLLFYVCSYDTNYEKKLKKRCTNQLLVIVIPPPKKKKRGGGSSQPEVTSFRESDP